MRHSAPSLLREPLVRAAWPAPRDTAGQTPGLWSDLMGRQPELLVRFAAAYTQLQALPRRARRALHRQLGLPLATLALWVALGLLPVQAATIPVGRACTLVHAIIAANTDTATGGCPAGRRADTIVLPVGSTQRLTQVDNHTYGATGLPVIHSAITIAGHGSTITRVSEEPFRIFAVGSTGQLTLQETTVSGGDADIDGRGGGVANFGTLTVTNSTIVGNSSLGSTGGEGGGVANFGTCTIRNSTLADNEAMNLQGDGGGLANFGTCTVRNSTLTGNGANRGGGVANFDTLTVTNSTITGNGTISYFGDGGGIVNFGTLTVLNSTITGNSTDNDGGGVTNSGTLTLVRTLISGNHAVGGDDELYNVGTVVADAYNLFGVDGTAGVEGFSPGPTDLVPPAGVLLGDILDPTLANNGGPTATHALVPGSPAIDAAGPMCVDADGAPLTTDQRGQPRPVDGDGDGLAACDIGAFEFP